MRAQCLLCERVFIVRTPVQDYCSECAAELDAERMVAADSWFEKREQEKEDRTMNTAARSMKWARERDWMVHKVERYMKFPNMKHGRRVDAFGFGDILAVRGSSILLIQTCGADVAKHFAKMVDNCTAALHAWLFAGGLVEIWSWTQPGGKRTAWVLRRWRVIQPRGMDMTGAKTRAGDDGTEFARFEVT